MTPTKRLFLLLSAATLGVLALSLALFYGLREGEAGPQPLRETLFGLVDYAAERGYLDEEELEGFLNSVGWTSDRLEATLDRMTQDDPELFWGLLEELEEYARQRHGVDLWELGIG